eukprot:1191510-Prorocentrum_minimum.AAC.2
MSLDRFKDTQHYIVGNPCARAVACAPRASSRTTGVQRTATNLLSSPDAELHSRLIRAACYWPSTPCSTARVDT